MNFLTQFYSKLSPDERRTFRHQLAAIFIVVTLLNLGFYWQRAFRETAARRNVQSVLRGWDGLAWYVWMPAAPATLLLIRRYPFVRDQAARSVARLALGSAGIYFVVTNTRYLLRIMPNLWAPAEQQLPVDWSTYIETQIDRTPLDFLTYCGLFAASFAIDYYSQSRQRTEEVMRLQLRAAQLESELARHQLNALRGQLHPHFLFNSFNAISTLIRQQRNREAAEMIAQLSELLRFVMENIEIQEHALAQEIEFIEGYLGIERVRFGDKLVIAIDVPESVRDALVPNLLLQPLVENAIKHGISRRTTEGHLRITATREGGRLHIEIADDGPGRPAPAAEKSTGIGLSNTRRRLEHVYGRDHRFELITSPAGGTIARLDLPWRDAPAVLVPAEAAHA